MLLENENNECGAAGGLKHAIIPKWPVERVANWLIIPPIGINERAKQAPCTIPGWGDEDPAQLFFGLHGDSTL